ncbi:MAG: hypothetical protein CMG07_01585 [Candidatus Marinimicrobia bacterium]|nr:hypothetical protein [Candidatus Neomarinimicrobiota bacterium]
MNKKTIIIITVLGLGIGSFVAFKTNTSPSYTPMSHESTNDIEHRHSGNKHHNTEVSHYKESLEHYFELQNSLANDNLNRAKQAAEKLAAALGNHNNATPLAHQVHSAESIETARRFFESLSSEIERLILHHGIPEGMHIGKYYCPMVDGNRGASWLQNSEGTLNPYFGAQMLRCGSKLETLE